jgi:glycosyltransferase involved in cell wall biosynthesis
VRTFLIADALKKLGCEVQIAGFVFDGEPLASSSNTANTAASGTAGIFTVPGGQYPQFLGSVKQILDYLDGDVIYALKLRPASYGVALLKRSLAGRRVIVDIDDWELSWFGGDRYTYRPSLPQLARDLLGAKGALRNPEHPLYLKWIERWSDRADAITVHTQAMQERFGGTWVPNGKDIDLFNPDRHDPDAARQQWGLSDYRVVMFPGAPRPYKGVEDLLTAIAQLNWPDLRLVIVGGSPYDDYDRQLLERWGRWIIHLPPQPAHTMPAVVAAAHVIAVPQRDTPETRAQFPLKLTDGMAMAKPVLATRVGDIPQILGDTGYLADPANPLQLAEQLRQIFDHWEQAGDRGRAARDRCVQHYSLDTMAQQLSPLLDRVLQSATQS